MNQFSIIARDDNEFTGEGCTQCTCQDLSVNNGIGVPNELINADAVMNELMNEVICHRKHNAAKSNAHQVSFFAKSEVDSKGVHHIRVTLDGEE